MPMNFLDDISKKTRMKYLSVFFKKILDKNLVLVVDSLDESAYLFDKNNPNENNLQAVVDSILHEELLTLALGNQNDILFDFLIFLPSLLDLKISF